MPIDQSSRPQPPGPPTLSDVTRVGRESIKYIIIGFISYLVLKLFTTSFISWWKATHPEAPPPPTVGFGRLTQISFMDNLQEDPLVSYSLETRDGRLPSFPDRAKVFLMPKFSPSLLADDRVRSIAGSYEFESAPVVLDSNNYRWIRSQPLETIFEINLKSYNFSLTTDYLSRAELVKSNPDLPDRYEAINTFKGFLRRGKLLPEDVATSSGRVNYLKALGGELRPAVSLSDADFVSVDLNRVPIGNQYSMYTPEGEEGIMHGIIAGGLGRNSVVEAYVRYQSVDYDQVETYPLRPVSESWSEVQKGIVYTASGRKLEKVVVRDVVLGYFDDFKEQEYLQPIYVFVGDDDFLGYSPAIDLSYYQAN